MLTATPAVGYNFKSWTEGGSTYSNNITYTLPAYSDRNLVANFAEVALTPAAPKLLYPANYATVYGSDIKFEWEYVPGATKYSIEAVNANQSLSFETSQNYAYIIYAPQDGTSYNWRIRAGNEYGWGPWSETRRVTSW